MICYRESFNVDTVYSPLDSEGFEDCLIENDQLESRIKSPARFNNVTLDKNVFSRVLEEETVNSRAIDNFFNNMDYTEYISDLGSAEYTSSYDMESVSSGMFIFQ